MSNETKDQECCPKFEPAPWDDKVFEWENKKFIRDSVCTAFYMPLNFGRVMRRLNSKAAKAGAVVTDSLCLSDHLSGWKMDLYLAVNKEVPDAENLTLSGNYFSKCYEGPFKDTGKWTADFKSDAGKRGFETGKIYLWYTTCPKCARKYGKNWVVVIGAI
ncbi:MAG: hydrolase [bacterium]